MTCYNDFVLYYLPTECDSSLSKREEEVGYTLSSLIFPIFTSLFVLIMAVIFLLHLADVHIITYEIEGICEIKMS